MVKSERFSAFLHFIKSTHDDQSSQEEDIEQTNYGISQQYYDAYHREICRKNGMKDDEIEPAKSVMKLTDQEIEDFYQYQYEKHKIDKIEDIYSGYLYFKTIMQLGPMRATKLLQQACNTQNDGIFGKNTVSALNSMDKKEFQTRFCDERRQCFRNNRRCTEREEQEILIYYINKIKEENKNETTQSQGDLQQSQTKENQEENKTQDQQQPGGIDCKVNISLLNRIKGINQLSARFLIESQENIILSDLATVLRVFLDPEIDEMKKVIAFSLDPVIIPDQEIFQEQEKVCYPDKNIEKNIIQNTEFARVLFESDFLLKLMTLGVEADQKTPFNYPEELKELEQIVKLKQQSNKRSTCRYWLAPQQCFYHYKNNKYIIEDMKVICQTKEAKLINNKVEDSDIQDKQELNYQFAEKFTQLYGKIEKYYPIFSRLKQLFKAVALGRWMYENRVNIHYQELFQFCQTANNEPKVIPIVKSIPQKSGFMSIQSLIKNHLSDQEDLQNLFEEICESIPNLKNEQIPTQESYSVGGVNTLCQNMIQSNYNPKLDKFQGLKEIDIPFLTQKKCTECNRMIESNLLNLEQNQCSIHSDCTCYMCLEIITYEESDPRHCLINHQSYILHSKCFIEYQRILNGQEELQYLQ